MQKTSSKSGVYVFPFFLFGLFWALAITLWQTTGNLFYFFNFGYIGTSIAVGIGLYISLPAKKKPTGRRVAQFLVGAYMLFFLGLFARENMQIEGFFFYLLAGMFYGAVIHYLVAKIFGVFIFNRGWCGWSCWTAMILDLLPFRRHRQAPLASPFWALRYLHFGLSLGLVAVLWWGFGYRVQEQSVTELYWLVGGNALYYALGIALAFLLKDNRAFCKYVCPIPTLQKIPARFALLKIAGDLNKCTDCGACTKMCPMDIDIPAYLQKGQRVLSTECVFCLECINVCTKGALAVNFAFDRVRH
ncbi:MAG: 4Fe-4S dicluster domain-containing protein [Anaerolineales bacterium]|nr:4Fe-4S binding protein [Anaerolineales bacterium]MDW8447711.1 4Fe-4S dicluster domain-containing protein [Anaerolineales bacterium]